MNCSIVLFIILFHLYLNQEYQIRYYLIGLEMKNDMTLYCVDNCFKEDIYFSGRGETLYYIIHVENETTHDLVFLLDESDINGIERFPETTIFIILKDYANLLEYKHRKYKIFIIDTTRLSASVSFSQSTFCIIGKKLDETILIVFQIFAFSSFIICLIIFFLNKKMREEISEENRLKIHSLINIFCIFLINLIFSNGLGFIIYSIFFNNYAVNFICLTFYSGIKIFYYSSMCFSLSGDMILSFNKNEIKFKKIRKTAIFCSIFLTTFIKIFTCFSYYITELKLLYTKRIFEHFFLLCWTIYFINKKLIPLYNQMKYEQRMDSELVECINFKFQRMRSFTIFMLIYNIFFIASTPIEHNYIFSYIDNIKIYLSIQVLYEVVFFIFFFIIFQPTILPKYYFQEVIFNYDNPVILRVNISKKSNISILTSNILEKNTNFPIVLYDPYISDNQFSSKGMNIGIVQK